MFAMRTQVHLKNTTIVTVAVGIVKGVRQSPRRRMVALAASSYSQIDDN
jgi:hypothetical protein